MRQDDPAAATAWPIGLAEAAANATPSLLLVVDTARVIRYVNAAAAQALHIAPQALAGRALDDLLDRGSRAKAERFLTEAFARAPTIPIELNHTTGDGQVVMITYRVAVLDHPDAALLLVGQPAAPTISATERLLALNRRLQSLFQLAATASRSIELRALLERALAVLQAEIGLQGCAIFLQDTVSHTGGEPLRLQLAAQLGMTEQWVSRLTMSDPFGAFNPADMAARRQSVVWGSNDEVHVAPEDLAYVTGPLLTVAATPLVSDSELFGWLYVVSDRYTALPPDELDLLQTAGNLLGPPVENARLYAALRETSGQLGAVLDSIDSGVLLSDEDGVVRYANARLGAILGVDATAWPGQPSAALLPAALTPLAEDASYFAGELYELGGAAPRILRRYTERVQDHAGAALGSIDVWSDITQIYRTNQLRDEFVAAAAHDLKTPVTAVKGYAQIALRLARKLDEPRLLHQLAMINARSDDLAVLMDSILDMSRIQGGRLQLELDQVEVGALTAAVVRHFEFDLQRRQRTLTADLPAEPIVAEWDRHRIEGVLINLVGNAFKYSPDGGEVTISARHLATGSRIGADAVEIAVTDHGIGIPVAERERIFERFYRAEAAVAHGFRGTGIGLYISQTVVALHGGRMWAADALHGGQGTTMFVHLPCSVRDALGDAGAADEG